MRNGPFDQEAEASSEQPMSYRRANLHVYAEWLIIGSVVVGFSLSMVAGVSLGRAVDPPRGWTFFLVLLATLIAILGPLTWLAIRTFWALRRRYDDALAIAINGDLVRGWSVRRQTNHRLWVAHGAGTFAGTSVVILIVLIFGQHHHARGAMDTPQWIGFGVWLVAFELTRRALLSEAKGERPRRRPTHASVRGA